MKTFITTIAITLLSSMTVQSFAHNEPDSKPTKPKTTVNLDVCNECNGNEFIFDGAGLSFMRVFNHKGHLMELNTMLPKSQIIYVFENPGHYTFELNYKNGKVVKKEVSVLN